MNPFRRQLAPVLITLMCALGAAPQAGAQGAAAPFPSKTITLVVPYQPGGAPDTLARLLAPKLAASLGQTVVVENRPGASGNIAAAGVAHASADGHTILLATEPMVTINPHLFKNMGYDPAKDLTPITAAVNVVMALSVSAQVPATTVPELVAYLKANPGSGFGTSGIGTPMHLAGLRLARLANVEVVHVPYRGGALVLGDLAGNSIKFGFVDLASTKSFAEGGKIRILAIGEPRRSEVAGAIPTLAETYPGLTLTSWFAFFGPAGMPAAVTERWSAELKAALLAPDVKDKLQAMGISVRPDGPAELTRMVRTGLESFGREVQDNKITVE
jgi:tripartite-type tricarboxylate transporter receptor subunit TctC